MAMADTPKRRRFGAIAFNAVIQKRGWQPPDFTIVSISEHHSHGWCFPFMFSSASGLHREEQTRRVSAPGVHAEDGGPLRLRPQGEFSKYRRRGTVLWLQLPTRFSFNSIECLDRSLCGR